MRSRATCNFFQTGRRGSMHRRGRGCRGPAAARGPSPQPALARCTSGMEWNGGPRNTGTQPAMTASGSRRLVCESPGSMRQKRLLRYISICFSCVVCARPPRSAGRKRARRTGGFGAASRSRADGGSPAECNPCATPGAPQRLPHARCARNLTALPRHEQETGRGDLARC